jgi:hypothetical protein
VGGGGGVKRKKSKKGIIRRMNIYIQFLGNLFAPALGENTTETNKNKSRLLV